MAYAFQCGKMYRMPTHFGPLMGPRQGPDGRRFECRDNPKNTSISVSFLSNAAQLEALLPDCFELGDRPIVTVYATYMVEEHLIGDGRVTWKRARWEDLPTMYNIVNALADLEVVEYLGGSLTRTIGGKDLIDQRVLR